MPIPRDRSPLDEHVIDPCMGQGWRLRPSVTGWMLANRLHGSDAELSRETDAVRLDDLKKVRHFETPARLGEQVDLHRPIRPVSDHTGQVRMAPCLECL